jgi:uncharacterized membrane protein
MEKSLNDYLGKIEKCLKPLPASERVDIVKEIKSEILELQGEGKTAEEIVERLGKPDKLAKAYLSDLITKETSFSWSRVLAICAYYSVAGLSGVIVIPLLGICAPAFFLSGILCPIFGAAKLIMTGFGMPDANLIEIAGIDNPFLAFVASIIMGVLLCLAGWGCWKLLVYYIKGMGKVKNGLEL